MFWRDVYDLGKIVAREEQAVCLENGGDEAQAAAHRDEAEWSFGLRCRWRRFVHAVTGIKVDISTLGENGEQTMTGAHHLDFDMRVAVHSEVYQAGLAGTIGHGPETRTHWLSILQSIEAATDRLCIAQSVLTDYSTAVDAVRIDSCEGLGPASPQQIVADDTCCRIITRLTPLRVMWQAGSTSWLRMCVTKDRTRLSTDEFVALIRFRLSASRCNELIREGRPVTCGCARRQPLEAGDDTVQCHLSRCSSGKAMTIAWHNAVARTLCRMIDSLGAYRVTREPKHYQDGDNRFAESTTASDRRRPDIRLVAKAHGHTSLVDVTITSITNKATLAKAFRDPAGPLQLAHDRKIRTYARASNTNQLLETIAPFVVSSHGVLGTKTRQWLTALTAPLLMAYGKTQAQRWKHYWYSLLAETCVRGLAQQMLAQTEHLAAKAARAPLAAAAGGDSA